MKQLVQFIRSGETQVVELPSPSVSKGDVLIRTFASVVSAGTEGMIVDFAAKNLLQKAVARPDLVKDIFAKAHRDGVASAGAAVLSRLEQPMGLGYSSAGEVLDLGEDVTDLRIGDRVACAGAGYAVHSEFASIPRMLVVKIPDGCGSIVSFEEAAFATIGSIALHAIRLAHVTVGDTVAVLGLGLVGQLAAQLLNAAGCHVVGMDPDPDRCHLAKQLGAVATASKRPEMVGITDQLSQGRGADSVVIAASTSTNEPLVLAGEIARDRCSVIAIGSVNLELPRKHYYEKELKFRVSRSYGPGRYDPEYEERGVDYPIGFVRWTENRNMEAFLELLRNGRLNVEPLITHRFQIENSGQAYELLSSKHRNSTLGIVITYPHMPEPVRKIRFETKAHRNSSSTPETARIGLLGAGAFACGTLLPAIAKDRNTDLVAVCTRTGLTGYSAARRFKFNYCTTDENELFADASINTVVIATRHHLHARQVISALEGGKHVFCEKPLCLNAVELADIVRTLEQNGERRYLMIGYNRRFAPMACQVKRFVQAFAPAPLIMHYRVNAGSLPSDHWTRRPLEGGGRIVGEVCHFVDFLSFMCGAPPVRVRAHSSAPNGESPNDNVVITVEFKGGSVGSIVYATNGDRSFSKERFEVYVAGAVAVIDDFRILELVANGKHHKRHSWLRGDKGHEAEWRHFTSCVKSDIDPMNLNEIVASSLATFAISESLQANKDVPIDTSGFITACLSESSQT